mmetsp:Transcript_36454/g.79772  ORF Transcript_36454/g.79772 Transcript_36454/m.79772 type:complete len:347 (+) Transcript_36454:44-1084(+)
MDLKARLQRRAALRRATPAEEVDVAAVRRFWEELSPEAKTDVLRWEDPSVVNRLHDHMGSLCKAELWCMANRMEGLTTDGIGERLKGFEFERPIEGDCFGRPQGPTAFCVMPEHVEETDLIQELEEHLGGPLLTGRPVLQPRDWFTITEASPCSWDELQTQVLRLVELAIFYAQRDAAAASANRCPAPETDRGHEAAEKELLDAEAEAEARISKSARRRAKKKKAVETAQQEQSETPAAVPEPDQAAENDVEENNVEEFEGSESKVETKEVDSRPSKSYWSGWLPSIIGDVAEWRWVVTSSSTNLQDSPPVQVAPAGIRAVVRNTFVDVEREEDCIPARRMKSAYF